MSVRLGTQRLGAGRLAGDLAALPVNQQVIVQGGLVPLFTQRPIYPGVDFAAEMTLDLYLYATVEVVGIPEDELLLIASVTGP